MKIEFSKNAERQFRKLDIRVQEKIINVIDKFVKGEKVDIKKLKGYEDLYRVRTGDFRIAIRRINSDSFIVTFIGKSENFYEF